jgi:hypothetical protein
MARWRLRHCRNQNRKLHLIQLSDSKEYYRTSRHTVEWIAMWTQQHGRWSKGSLVLSTISSSGNKWTLPGPLNMPSWTQWGAQVCSPEGVGLLLEPPYS